MTGKVPAAFDCGDQLETWQAVDQRESVGFARLGPVLGSVSGAAR